MVDFLSLACPKWLAEAPGCGFRLGDVPSLCGWVGIWFAWSFCQWGEPTSSPVTYSIVMYCNGLYGYMHFVYVHMYLSVHTCVCMWYLCIFMHIYIYVCVCVNPASNMQVKSQSFDFRKLWSQCIVPKFDHSYTLVHIWYSRGHFRGQGLQWLPCPTKLCHWREATGDAQLCTC